ncbi:MAG: hypothetical protein ABH827_04865, partial [bacterium]
EILKTIYRELKKIEAKFYEYTNKPQPIQSTNLSIAKDLMSKNAPLDPVTITEQLTFELLEAKFKTIEKFIDEELKKYKPITIGMVKDWIKKISTDQALIEKVTKWLDARTEDDDKNIRENIETWASDIRNDKEGKNQESNKKLLLYIDDLLNQAIITKALAEKWLNDKQELAINDKQELAIAEIKKKLKIYDQDANIKETLTKWRDELFAQPTLVGNEILIQFIAILLKQGTITKRMIKERIEKAKNDNEKIKQIEDLLKTRLKKPGKVLNENDDIKQDIQNWKKDNVTLGAYIDNLLAYSKAEPDGFIKDLVDFLKGEEIRPTSHDLGVAGFEILLSKLSELFKKLKLLKEEGNKETLNENAKNMWKIFSRITVSKFKEEIENDLDRFVAE